MLYVNYISIKREGRKGGRKEGGREGRRKESVGSLYSLLEVKGPASLTSRIEQKRLQTRSNFLGPGFKKTGIALAGVALSVGGSSGN